MTTSDVGDSQQSHDLRRAAEQGTIRRAEHHGSSHAHTRTPGTEDLLSRQYTRDDVDKWARAAGPEISPTAFLLLLTSVEVTHPDSGDVNSTVQALANDGHMSRKLAAAKLNELAAVGYTYYSTERMQTALGKWTTKATIRHRGIDRGWKPRPPIPTPYENQTLNILAALSAEREKNDCLERENTQLKAGKPPRQFQNDLGDMNPVTASTEDAQRPSITEK